MTGETLIKPVTPAEAGVQFVESFFLRTSPAHVRQLAFIQVAQLRLAPQKISLRINKF
jgi:hypothetical protein